MTEGELSALLHLIRSPDVCRFNDAEIVDADDRIVPLLEGPLPPLLFFN